MMMGAIAMISGTIAALTTCCQPREVHAIVDTPVTVLAVPEVRGLSTVKGWYKEVLEAAQEPNQEAGQDAEEITPVA